MNENERKFWNNFVESKPDFSPKFGSAWSFGSDKCMANELAKLVLEGKKTATASAKIEYDLENEPLPVSNQYFDILLNGEGIPVAILQTTNVYVMSFNQITPEHAYKESEGDRTLDYWQKVHREFWSESFKEKEIEIDIETMDVVCEEFEVVYQ